jgi:hypothetical protein
MVLLALSNLSKVGREDLKCVSWGSIINQDMSRIGSAYHKRILEEENGYTSHEN